MMVNLPCLQGSRPNFLRPTCSYTECQLSFFTGSMPYGRDSCRLQLLFVFDYLLTCLVPHSTDSVDASLYLPLVGHLLTEILFPVPFGFLSRTLLNTRCFCYSAGSWSASFSDRLCYGCLYVFWISDVLQQFLWIIPFSCLQHRTDHSKELTCDHDQ